MCDAEHGSMHRWYQAMVLAVRRSEGKAETRPLESTCNPQDSVSPAAPTIEVLIGFVGWHAGADEWIDITSRRLAPLDSRSKGQRGVNMLRPEMLHVASEEGFHVLLQDAKDDVHFFAVRRENTWTSSYLADHINWFGAMTVHGKNGFQWMLEVIEHGKLPFDQLASLVGSIGQVYLSLSSPFCKNFVKNLKESTQRYVCGLHLSFHFYSYADFHSSVDEYSCRNRSFRSG